MLSIAAVRSASGAANYYAKDDHYTLEGSSEISCWAGAGAETLNLSGKVSKDAFEAILRGFLPSGEGVAQVSGRRAGVDLTFSMPKSASVMAYVAGDRRVLDANMLAVRQTMAWVESNLAQGRRDVEGRKVPVNTGNLVQALFQHDTSRALDPQGHIHVIVANLTRMPDGKWQALHADKLWSQNSVIGSIYHAHLRNELEKIGYMVELRGKHGSFEIVGVPERVLAEFSQRRADIVERAAILGIASPQGMRAVSLRSRNGKVEIEDREGLMQEWQDRAAAFGFDGKDMALAAEARAGLHGAGLIDRGSRAFEQAFLDARERLGAFLRPHDPLVDQVLARAVRSPAEARAQLAVASAVRILSEREAAWPIHQLGKVALDLGLRGVTAQAVEQRIAGLVQQCRLIPGTALAADRSGRMVTTPEALRTEQAILAQIEAGRGSAPVVVRADAAPARLQAASGALLNAGQLAAATMILASPDLTVTVQGVAGAGKSTMLGAVARVAEAEGRAVLGLAFQNKMVGDLAEGAGIRAQTVASFVAAHEGFLFEPAGLRYEAAREALAGTILVVDESSMVPSGQVLALQRITETMGIAKLVLVGDRQQLSSIEAGKAFAMIQAGGGTMARMDENLRQRTDELRTVAALANAGRASQAMAVLGKHVVENAQPALAAAELWLGLPAADRDATMIFASGLEARATINQRIQDGLIAEGRLQGGGMSLTVQDRVNATREELRYAATYRPGQLLQIPRGGAADVGLPSGAHRVRSVSNKGIVELRGHGRRIRFDPQQLSPTDQRDRLQLFEARSLTIYEGDQIRWTANDKDRDMLNSALAKVVSIERGGVIVELADRSLVRLERADPMLGRLDLAYALNMHMAQGVTTDRAITVMSSKERQLSNQRLFNVGVTRVRDSLMLVVDDRAKLELQLDRNPGNKTSALETLGMLAIDRQDGKRIAAAAQRAREAAINLTLPLPEKGLSLDL